MIRTNLQSINNEQRRLLCIFAIFKTLQIIINLMKPELWRKTLSTLSMGLGHD